MLVFPLYNKAIIRGCGHRTSSTSVAAANDNDGKDDDDDVKQFDMFQLERSHNDRRCTLDWTCCIQSLKMWQCHDFSGKQQ